MSSMYKVNKIRKAFRGCKLAMTDILTEMYVRHRFVHLPFRGFIPSRSRMIIHHSIIIFIFRFLYVNKYLSFCGLWCIL